MDHIILSGQIGGNPISNVPKLTSCIIMPIAIYKREEKKKKYPRNMYWNILKFWEIGLDIQTGHTNLAMVIYRSTPSMFS